MSTLSRILTQYRAGREIFNTLLVMWWRFVVVVITSAGLGPRADSLDQGLAQMFQFGDLRLLIRECFLQRRQQVLLVGKFRLNINDFLVVHRCHQITPGIETLRARTDFFNPDSSGWRRQAPATCILAAVDTHMPGNACR